MGHLQPYVFIPKVAPDGRPILDSLGQPVIAVGNNPIKEHVRAFHFSSKPVVVVLAAFGAAGDSAEVEFIIDSQGPFDWTHIVGQSTGAYTLKFFDPASQDLLQNKPVHSGTVVGTARRPFKLPEPYLFNVEDKERRMIVTLKNLLGSQNTIRLNLYGRRYYIRESQPDTSLRMAASFEREWRINDYFMAIKEADQFGIPPTVPALGSLSFRFAADHDADTELSKLMVFSTGAFNFNLEEADTDRRLSNETIHSDNGWGNAEFPFYFADGWLIEKNKELKFSVTDLSGDPNQIFATIAARRLRVK